MVAAHDGDRARCSPLTMIASLLARRNAAGGGRREQPVAVNVAPVIPGLNDHEIPSILEAARAAGATRAHHILVRLPGPVAAVFEERLREAFPSRADAVLAKLRRARGGELNEARFGYRMEGSGPEWQATSRLFDTYARRLGFERGETSTDGPSPFRRPRGGPGQQRLFG